MAKKLLGQLMEDFRRQGQSLQDFAGEVKLLTPADKADFRRYYADAGITVDPD